MPPYAPGEEKLSGRFQQKLTDVAGRLGANPDDLLAVMSFETGGSFDPSVRNQAGSGATGLLQFLPSTARQLGTTPAMLSQMTPEQQLDVVEQYLAPFKGRLGNLKDAYLAVLAPKAVGQPEHTVLFERGTRAYQQNAGLDVRDQGQVTIGDVLSRLRRHLGLGVGTAEAGTLDDEIAREIARARRQTQDDLTPEYLEAKNKDIDAEIAAETARARAPQPMERAVPWDEALRGIHPLTAGAADALALRTTSRPGGGTEPPPLSLSGRLSQDSLQVLGGARDMFLNTMQTLNLLGDWLREHGIGPEGTLTVHLPEVPKADTVEGPMIRSATQFLTGFLPLTGLVKALGVTSQIPLNMLGGALTDFAAFDPRNPRVSNLLNDLVPALRNPITTYLAAAPDDTDAEGRLKNTLEGLGLGVLIHGVLAATKALRTMRQTRQGIADALPEGPVKATILGDDTATATAKPAAMAPERAQTLPRAGPMLTDEEIAQDLATRGAAPTTIRVSDSTAASLSADATDLVSVGPATREHAQQFQTLTASGAAETLPTAGRFLHINFDRIQTGDDLKQTIATVAEVMRTETQAQRRGTQSLAETTALAAQSPYRELDRILGITPGTALNAEDALATRQVWLAAAHRMHQLSQQLAQGDLSVAYDWMKQFVLTANIQTKVAGITAEAGRALRMFGVDMPTTEKHFLDTLADTLTHTTPTEDIFRSVGAGGASQHAMQLAQQIAGIHTPQQLATAAMVLQQQYTPQQLARLSQQQQLAAMLAQLTTPTQLAQFMVHAQGITRADMVKELWYGALLSAPPTHVVNALDSALRVLWSIPERYFATAMGHPRDLLKNFQAANQYTYGLKQGLQESWQYAAQAFRTGRSRFGSGTKLPYQSLPALTAQNLGMAPSSLLYDYVDLLGGAARLAGRGLLATDEFFKVLSYRMQLHESAFRAATEEGLTGTPLAQRIVALTQTPTPELVDRATAWAQYQTLGQSLTQEDAAFANLGKFVEKIAEGTDQWLPAKIVLPFIKTPFNIVRFGLERTPVLGNLSANVNRKLLAGGAEGALARSQMVLGSMGLAMFALLAAEDVITGKAPADPGQRQTWERLGKQEYSVWVPGLQKYVSYNRLDLVGLPMGLAADFVQIARDAPMSSLTELAGGMLGAIFNSVTSKTWLKGVADVIDAVTPGRGQSEKQSGTDFERYLRQLLGSLVVPPPVALAARMLDPIQRDTRTLIDTLLNRLPGLSQFVPPRLDRWGRERLRAEPLGPDLVSPFLSRDYEPDAVDLELARLGTPLRMPERSVNIPRADRLGSDTIELTPQQYHRLVKLSAGEGMEKPLKEAIRDLMQGPGFRDNILSDGPRGGKSNVILDLVQHYDAIGLAKLRQEDPSINQLLERRALTRTLMQTTEGQEQLRRMQLPVGGQ